MATLKDEMLLSHVRKNIYKTLLMAMLLLNTAWCTANSNIQLPSLGENSAGLISLADEYELGQALIKRYRASVPTSRDPFIEDYLQRLLQQIVAHSDLSDKRLQLIILDTPSLNAFAAPGGIVGVNTGTFLSAQNEQQLASILAHEIAHLSQRHYARRLQQHKTNYAVSMAALLASIMVAASGNGDVGMAGITAVQAASIDSSLRFSRSMELEADRIGMQTLVRGGFDPYAMPGMFEQMLRSARYRTKVPEFLLTHPVTESRIADSMARARKYPQTQRANDEEFQLIQARVLLHHENNSAYAVRRFEEELGKYRTLSAEATHYGYVIALTRHGDLDKAREALPGLKKHIKNPVAIAIAAADIEAAAQNHKLAIEILEEVLQSRPSNHPINVRMAEILMAAGEYKKCQELLLKHVQRQPENAYVWYLLAEVHGLAGNILQVHRARAEYFILLGAYSKAEIQLRNAIKLTDEKDFQAQARLDQRLLDVKEMQKTQL